MMILCELGNYQPLWRLQTWMLERLVAAQLGSTDLRWGMIALVLNLLAAAGAFGRRRFVSPRPPRASGRQNPADTMVAAALR
ncbi:hypothetical protein [Bradyrhizobium sp.]|uniref:hypothetical protein n=1 Tax=Bradyrhizobium sp. TaxID=376 RepID=UPI004037C170